MKHIAWKSFCFRMYVRCAYMSLFVFFYIEHKTFSFVFTQFNIRVRHSSLEAYIVIVVHSTVYVYTNMLYIERERAFNIVLIFLKKKLKTLHINHLSMEIFMVFSMRIDVFLMFQRMIKLSIIYAVCFHQFRVNTFDPIRFEMNGA